MSEDSTENNSSKSMLSDEDSVDLLARCANDLDSAANVICARYAGRLLGFVRSRLSGKLAARIDAEDVLQSAWGSFFRRASGGEFQLERSGDLWRLLIQITAHKLFRKVSYHQANKRGIEHEERLQDAQSLMSCEPSPEIAATLVDQVEWLIRKLPPLGRQVLELRLLGQRLEEIAAELSCSERTVRRQLDYAREIMKSELTVSLD